MKRPSGFDRTPEPPEPRRHPVTPEPTVSPEPTVAPEPTVVPEQLELPDLPAPASVEPAATVDLSEVREAKAAREGGVLARLRADRDEDPVRQAERRVRDAGRQRRSQERRERRRFSAEARKRRRYWLIALGTIVALVVFVAVGVFTPLMAVRNVQVVGASSVNVADVEQALARFDGVPLALVRDDDVHTALSPFPLIQRYAIELIPPDTLKVRIEERIPVLSIEADGMFNLYDAAGVLLGSAEAPAVGVPVASGGITDLTSEAFSAASRVLRDMPAELRAQVVSVVASSGQDVTLVLTSGVEVLWGDADETRRKALVLTSMLSSLADRPITHIDVSSSSAPVFR